MIDAGIFRPDERVELIDGEILAMTPQKSQHATALMITADRLRSGLGPGWLVRTQMPLAVDQTSMPEPDIAVVAGQAADYWHAHPTTAVLVVEIAESTLRSDRQRKRPLYARAGIGEYWIVNLDERVLEVYREPVETSEGWAYRLIRAYTPDETVAPLPAPDSPMRVSDLLPPA
jgi:Uma2 family endonuclease